MASIVSLAAPPVKSSGKNRQVGLEPGGNPAVRSSARASSKSRARAGSAAAGLGDLSKAVKDKVAPFTPGAGSGLGLTAYRPRSVVACEGRRWVKVIGHGGRVKVVPFRCGSWRCERCRFWWGRSLSKRVYETLRVHQLEKIVFLTATFDPGQWVGGRGYTAQEVCFLAAYRCFVKFVYRLRRYLGRGGHHGQRSKVDYVAVLEQTKKGWPHFHVAFVNEDLAALVARDRVEALRRGRAPGLGEWKRKWLEPALGACGFGRVSEIDVARDHAAVANYVVKCAAGEVAEDVGHLVGEQSKLSQLPLYAPRGFRRIRAAQKFLKGGKKRRGKDDPPSPVSVSVLPWSFEEVMAECDQRLASVALRAARAEGLRIDEGTGEVGVNLFGEPE